MEKNGRNGYICLMTDEELIEPHEIPNIFQHIWNIEDKFKITTDTTEFKYYEKDKSGNYQTKKMYLNPFSSSSLDQSLSMS